ncbi:MAG: choice-of-anchor tandem repeat GloVer-containing protein, partial [Candidatus Sulfotelmatobacter sp.]
MQSNRLPVLLLVFTSSLALATYASAQTEAVLHNFADNGTDGYQTYSPLVFDASGNLYGTTLDGGTHTNCYGENIGCGTVFELSPAVGGGWTENILYNFGGTSTDGTNPSGALIFDATGNLYGITEGGGTGVCDQGENSCGTVFELKPKAGGGWEEKILHNFGSTSTEGYYPFAGLISDAAGNLYGTTADGGTYGFGTVFELIHAADGSWAEKVLHSFNDTDDGGATPLASLIFDPSGNLYGTTTGGGSFHAGGIFELKRGHGGSWTTKVLHFFNDGDGRTPYASLILDAAGNLYGTTQIGGPNHGGTVFELTQTASGKWGETVLHGFDNKNGDGYEPMAGVIFDSNG